MNDKKSSFIDDRSVAIHTNVMPNNKDGVFWFWTALDGNEEIDSDDGFSYEQKPTSVVAQFLAVIKALGWTARNMPKVPVKIYSSNEFVVQAINGRKRVKKPHLIPLYKNARRLQDKTKAVVEWLPKEKIRRGH